MKIHERLTGSTVPGIQRGSKSQGKAIKEERSLYNAREHNQPNDALVKFHPLSLRIILDSVKV